MLEKKTREFKLKRTVNGNDKEDRKSQLALVDRKIIEVTEEKRSENSNYNTELKDLRAQQRALLEAIECGEETVTIQVYDKFVYETNTVEICKADTHEVVDRRAMTAEERQIDWTKEAKNEVKAKGNGGKAAAAAEAKPNGKARAQPKAKPNNKRKRKAAEADDDDYGPPLGAA